MPPLKIALDTNPLLPSIFQLSTYMHTNGITASPETTDR